MKANAPKNRMLFVCLVLGILACLAGRAEAAVAPPTLSVSPYNPYVLENAGSVQGYASLSATSAVPVTVDYHTADLTALAGSHYIAQSGTLTFQPGEVTKSASITILDN